MSKSNKKRKRRAVVKLDKAETFVLYTCKNCNYYFEGNFCPSCGQSVKEVQKPIGHFFGDMFGSMFALDMRAVRSVPDLLFKPGKLSSDYVEGRRVRHVAPFRLYLFASLIFFFIISWQTKNKIDLAFNNDFATNIDSLKNQLPVLQTTVSDGDKYIALENIKDGQGLIDMVQSELRKIMDEDDLTEKERLKIEKQVHALDNPDVVVSKVYQYISWSFFILMPWFAFILYVFLRKKRKFYVEHLIYSVNLHTFFFLIMIITALLGMAIPNLLEKGGAWVFLFIVIYSILGIRNFYKIKWFSSVFYSAIIFAAYLLSTLVLLVSGIIIAIALI